MEQLPKYKLILSPDQQTGVDAVALVDEPAIEINWVAFNKKQVFKTVDVEKRIISGPVMVADLPIIRQDAQYGAYYAIFDADTIYQIVQRFFKHGNTSRVNIMHDDNVTPEGVYMIESFLINAQRGINTPHGFDTLPDGSWFASYKVDNDDIWTNYVKTGVFKGFSIEGTFLMEPAGEMPVLPEDETLLKKIAQHLAAHLDALTPDDWAEIYFSLQ